MRGWIRRSFKARIFFTVLMVSMLPLLILDVIMLPLLIRHSESRLAMEAGEQLDTQLQTMQSVFSAFGDAAHALSTSTEIRQALLHGGVPDAEVYRVLFQGAEEVQPYARLGLYGPDGVCRYGIQGMAVGSRLDTDWGLLRAAADASGMVYSGVGEAALNGAMAVSGENGQPAGYVVLSITDSQLDTLFSGLMNTASNVILLDAYWRPVYRSQPAQGDAMVAVLRQQLLSGKSLDGGSSEFNFYVAREERTGLYLMLQKPKAFTAAVIGAFYAISAALGLLCLLLCLWGAWLLSRHLSKPVKELSLAMGRVERGDFTVRIETDRLDELGTLSKGFNSMVQEYRLNLDRSVKRQKELNDVQLRLMQAQLNPHFLYNTLDAMKWLGVTNHVPKVAALATDLATILRTSISREEMVTLEAELALIDHYINIQSIRFEDRFTCEIDVKEEFQSCLVPKLVLQPLVENAILHGVSGREDGYVKLWAERDGEALVLSVSDNGCGMPEELVEKLNSPDKRIQGGHLGLYNVDSIIRLHFGGEYGISARSDQGKGSCVSVRLPLLRKEEDHAEGAGGG